MNNPTTKICEYAIPGKEYSENYPFPYKCAVMYECIRKEPSEEGSEFCIRHMIGETRKRKMHQNQLQE